MINHLEKEIVLRFLKARKHDSFLNLISIFSFIGIALGVSVLIIVMSVMNGFRSELITKIVGFNPHLIISSFNNDLVNKNLENSEIKSLTENFLYTNNGEAIITQKNFNKGLLLRGYNQNDFKKLPFVNNENFNGNVKILPNKISIGREFFLL